jgi:uncharacterized protein YqgC (DUF456 family)
MFIAWVLQQLAGAYGAKKMGSSKWGIIGAIIGSFLGIFSVGVMGPFGFVIFPFLLAALFELIAGRTWQKSVKAGIGSVLGVFGGLFMQVIAALVMVVIFLIAIFV